MFSLAHRHSQFYKLNFDNYLVISIPTGWNIIDIWDKRYSIASKIRLAIRFEFKFIIGKNYQCFNTPVQYLDSVSFLTSQPF